MAKRYGCLLTVTGPKKLLDDFAHRAEGFPLQYRDDPLSRPNHLAISFHALVPVPQDLVARRYTRRSRTGVPDSGRDWELRNWGCPRGAIESAADRYNGGLLYIMLVLEAPPTPFVEAVSALFPKLQFGCISRGLRHREKVEVQFKDGQRLSSDPFPPPSTSPKVVGGNQSKVKKK
jgi:hypothetical protein